MTEIYRTFLPHYWELLEHSQTAYYRLCRQIPVEIPPQTTMQELWDLHRQTHISLSSKISPVSTPLPIISYLDLKIELAQRLLESCEFCEHHCKKNRSSGETGYCGISDRSAIASAFLHLGEERPLVPSGTIFFIGCTISCVFCQNANISTPGKSSSLNHAGRLISPKDLADIAEVLVVKGARNVNYVGGDPTPHIHTILASMKLQHHNTCQLWNSNLYNSIFALELLYDVIDVWLPDFKFGNNTCAQTYSGISRYWDVLTRNMQYIYTHGSKNIIVRHLVMPGHMDCCTKPILAWLARHTPKVLVNIMGQYHPDHLVSRTHHSEINRRVSPVEMQEAYDHAEALGLEYRTVS
ncbi:MAG: radical SAM protein [Promethearchaeota archaeon]